MSEKFIEGRIVGRVDYTDSLFSLRFEAPMDRFIAGQYCRAGLILPGARGAEITMRPYSMVNAPDQHPHELLLTLVPHAVGGIEQRAPGAVPLPCGDGVFCGLRPWRRNRGVFHADSSLWPRGSGAGLYSIRPWGQGDAAMLGAP